MHGTKHLRDYFVMLHCFGMTRYSTGRAKKYSAVIKSVRIEINYM